MKYLFSSSKAPHGIKGVTISCWNHDCIMNNKNIFFIDAITEKESDMILFLLKNPELKLLSKADT